MSIGDQDCRIHQAQVTVWICPHCGATSPPQIGKFTPPPDDDQLAAARAEANSLRERVGTLEQQGEWIGQVELDRINKGQLQAANDSLRRLVESLEHFFRMILNLEAPDADPQQFRHVDEYHAGVREFARNGIIAINALASPQGRKEKHSGEG